MRGCFRRSDLTVSTEGLRDGAGGPLRYVDSPRRVYQILAELRALAVARGHHIGLPRNAHSFDSSTTTGTSEDPEDSFGPDLAVGNEVSKGGRGQQWMLCPAPEDASQVVDCSLPHMAGVLACFRASLRLDSSKKKMIKKMLGIIRIACLPHKKKRFVSLYVRVAPSSADERQLCACGVDDKADSKGHIELDAASGHYMCSGCGAWTAPDLSQHSFLDAAYKAEWEGPDQRRAEVTRLDTGLFAERSDEPGLGGSAAQRRGKARAAISSQVQKKHRAAHVLASKEMLQTQDSSAIAAVLNGATLPVSTGTQKLLATRAAVFAVSVSEELALLETHVGRFGPQLTQAALSKSTAVFLQSVKHRYVAQCDPKTCSICIHDSAVSSKDAARAVLQHVLVGSGSHSIQSMLAPHAQEKLKALFSKRSNGFSPLPALQASVALLCNARVVLLPCLGHS